ncbi:1-phosphofructokinase family hexose kinase [Blastochloris viridis]|uniref:Phosphofructokinase n=1 Tax=Blastochloris viridis TaxID=1079 RepID=A0A0H5BFQ5_BLAVI|nr:1-phosphofructokinase family hexose kinase [Blastochloris viridis]ALK10829.1 Putative phosphofructokinase PfkB [Blastochloris viridis]BAR99196.1 tagatose-6-phosphate kinase [Blastochloris viridis]CUU43491.1 Putative phosphofructokinase pfkB [Blastochloris viridis]
MKPIVTLTLNPSIDGAAETDTIRPTHKIRTSNERYYPGGGGINVARVVAELGGPTRAVYAAGGATGPILDALIEKRGIAIQRIGIDEDTRISHSVYERTSGLEYRFVPEGPELQTQEWQACLDTLSHLDCDYLVASGSLPRGVPADFYVRVAEFTRRLGIRLVVDTSGTALTAVVEAGGLYLIKPSLGEFEQLVGAKLPDAAAQHAAAMALVNSGKVALIAVTLGHLGAFLAAPDGILRLPAMPIEAKSAVGAGDSFLAAMTLGLARGMPAREAFKLGMAAGTAAVLTPGTELCTRADVERLFAELTAAPEPAAE